MIRERAKPHQSSKKHTSQAKKAKVMNQEKEGSGKAGCGWHQKLLCREYGFGMKRKRHGMEVRMVATVGITRDVP